MYDYGGNVGFVMLFCFFLFHKESLTRSSGSGQDYAAKAEKKKIFDALALASILHNSALESTSKVSHRKNPDYLLRICRLP